MRLQFTRSATRDLIRLRAFIAEKDPQAASRVSRRLGRAIRQLRDHPALGKPLEDLPEVRELVAGDYIVRYILDEETVTILRIWHGREAR
jgi:plasmid stabilization system protein ParE